MYLTLTLRPGSPYVRLLYSRRERTENAIPHRESPDRAMIATRDPSRIRRRNFHRFHRTDESGPRVLLFVYLEQNSIFRRYSFRMERYVMHYNRLKGDSLPRGALLFLERETLCVAN